MRFIRHRVFLLNTNSMNPDGWYSSLKRKKIDSKSLLMALTLHLGYHGLSSHVCHYNCLGRKRWVFLHILWGSPSKPTISHGWWTNLHIHRFWWKLMLPNHSLLKCQWESDQTRGGIWIWAESMHKMPHFRAWIREMQGPQTIPVKGEIKIET